MGATGCGGKADLIFMPHSSTNVKVWCGALSPWNTTINWGLRNIPWADGWSVGSWYSHNFPGLRFQESPADNKMTFSSLLFVLEFMVRNITAFYSGCWYIATQSVLLFLNWVLCAINARNLSWAGVEQGGHPEWVRSLWEPVSRKRAMASPTTDLMQHKSTAILQWEQGKSEGFDSCDRPSNIKLDSNRQFFRLCDREIWWTTLQNNRAPLLCYFKLCASFRTHWWIQTSITVRKRSIWFKIDNFLSCVTLKFYGWPSKTIGHLFYAASSFVHHFVAIGEFKLQLQSGNAQSGSNLTVFRAVGPWNLTDDLAKQ